MAFMGETYYNTAVNVQQLGKIVDIRTKSISSGTLIAAFSYAIYHAQGVRVFEAVLLTIATLAIDMASTATNTYYDYKSGVDAPDKEKEEQKVLVHETLPPIAALVIALILFGFAGILGLVLAWRTSWLLLGVGVVSVGVGYGYTAGPFPIANTPVGELFAGGFLGSVLFCITLFTQGLTLNLQACVASVPLLLYIAMILSVNNVCDRVGDRQSGRRTLAILLPERLLVPLIALEGFGAYLLTLLFSVVGIFPPAMFWVQGIGAALFTRNFLKATKRGFIAKHKAPQMGFATQGYLLLTVGFLVGHLLG